MKSEETDPLWKIVDRWLKIALRFLVVVYAVMVVIDKIVNTLGG